MRLTEDVPRRKSRLESRGRRGDLLFVGARWAGDGG